MKETKKVNAETINKVRPYQIIIELVDSFIKGRVLVKKFRMINIIACIVLGISAVIIVLIWANNYDIQNEAVVVTGLIGFAGLFFVTILKDILNPVYITIEKIIDAKNIKKKMIEISKKEEENIYDKLLTKLTAVLEKFYL